MHHRAPEKNSSLSLLREPCRRPLGLPDWPGLNWVNSLPVTCFPPVDSGLRLTISVHRIRLTGRLSSDDIGAIVNHAASPLCQQPSSLHSRPAFASRHTYHGRPYSCISHGARAITFSDRA